MTTVVSVRVKELRSHGYADLREWIADAERNVYIGRGGVVFLQNRRYPPAASPWANPYKVGRDGSREAVLARYRQYVEARLQSGQITDEQLLALRGKRLGCWCKPEACHGDVLLALIQERSDA